MNRDSAVQLAQWVESAHPEIFATLYAKAINSGVNARPVYLQGFADDSDLTDLSSFTPTLSDISIDTGDATFMPVTSMDTGIIGTGDDSSDGSWLSTIGSGIANAAISVGTYLTSAQGLNTLANVGTAVLKTQQAQANAATQQAVLQQQIVRAQTGVSPVPITYVQDANGQTVPVYSTGELDGAVNVATLPTALQQEIAAGTATPIELADGTIGYQLSSNTLASVFGSNSSLIWIGLAALLLVAVL